MGSHALNTEEEHELVMLLADAGFQPWRCDSDGLDSFDHALSIKNAHILSWLATHPDKLDITERLDLVSGENPLWGAGLEAAKVLVDIGYSARTTNDYGNTLLHDTLDPDLIRFLITQGGDPYQANDAGRTAAQEWDACSLSLDAMRAIDKVLEESAPRRPDDLIAQFGEQYLNIGGPLTLERMKKAGINPKAANSKGYNLPEILISTLLDKGLRHRREIGDPSDIKKGKKAIQSALKTVGNIDPLAQTERMKRMRAIVYTYSAIADNIENQIHVADVEGDGEEDSFDKKTISLPELVGSDDDGVLNTLLRSVDALEDLYDAGLIRNISWLSFYLMRANKSTLISLNDWMTPTRDGTPLFFKLGHMAMRHVWDDCPISKDLLAHQTSPQLYDIPAYFYLQAPLIKNGLGTIMSLTNVPREQDAQAILRTLLQQGDQTGLSHKDPLLQHGKDNWLSYDCEAIEELITQIDLISDRNDLSRDTHPVLRSSVRRM